MLAEYLIHKFLLSLIYFNNCTKTSKYNLPGFDENFASLCIVKNKSTHIYVILLGVKFCRWRVKRKQTDFWRGSIICFEIQNISFLPPRTGRFEILKFKIVDFPLQWFIDLKQQRIIQFLFEKFSLS